MRKILLTLFFLVSLFLFSCKDKNNNNNTNPPALTDTTNVMGYGIFSKINGIWDGALYSGTSLPNFPSYVVDFRPISASQVSAKNELDSLNDIFMSLFLVRHNNQYKIAFRNGGGFAGMQRISYMIIDSVNETSTQSYYRFTDIIKGKKRSSTSFDFHDDSLIVKTYTNKNNSLENPVMHFIWRAKLKDATTAAPVISHFDFPKKVMVKDFNSTFNGLAESIFYSKINDVYPEEDQPYLGKTTINFTLGGSITPDPNKKVILIIMTQPLFNGNLYNAANLKYRSRYVTVPSNDSNFEFNYMHPGTYYVYGIYDTDGNLSANSGDYISFGNTTFTLYDKGTTSKTVNISFAIP